MQMTDSQTTVHIKLFGKVQGVFFRQGLADQAREKNVDGWVQNLDDGRVEAMLQGDTHQVTELLKWCEKGPTAAKVMGFDVETLDGAESFQGFEIR